MTSSHENNMTTIRDTYWGRILAVLFILPLVIIYVCSWVMSSGQKHSWDILIIGPARLAYFWAIWLFPSVGPNLAPLACFSILGGGFAIGLWHRKSTWGLTVAVLMIVLQYLAIGAATLTLVALQRHGL